MRALADLPHARTADVATVTPTARSRSREAARAWLDFWHHHTHEHPSGRCPVLRLYASYEAWADANARAVARLDDVLRWTADLEYRLVGRSPDGLVAASTSWFGVLGRAYDPEGWPHTWRWPDDRERDPPGWWIARSALRRGWQKPFTSSGAR